MNGPCSTRMNSLLAARTHLDLLATDRPSCAGLRIDLFEIGPVNDVLGGSIPKNPLDRVGAPVYAPLWQYHVEEGAALRHLVLL